MKVCQLFLCFSCFSVYNDALIMNRRSCFLPQMHISTKRHSSRSKWTRTSFNFIFGGNTFKGAAREERGTRESYKKRYLLLLLIAFLLWRRRNKTSPEIKDWEEKLRKIENETAEINTKKEKEEVMMSFISLFCLFKFNFLTPGWKRKKTKRKQNC